MDPGISSVRGHVAFVVPYWSQSVPTFRHAMRVMNEDFRLRGPILLKFRVANATDSLRGRAATVLVTFSFAGPN